MDSNLQTILDEVDSRLLSSVNGKVPEIISQELHQVLNDLNFTIVSKTGSLSAQDVSQFESILNSFVTSELEDVQLNTYAFFNHLSSLGWVIIPPQ